MLVLVNYHRNASSSASISPTMYVRLIRQDMRPLCWAILGSGAVSSLSLHRYSPKRAIGMSTWFSGNPEATWIADGGVSFSAVKAYTLTLCKSNLSQGRSGRARL